MEKFEWVAITEARLPLQNSPSPTYPGPHSHVTSRKTRGKIYFRLFKYANINVV